MAFPKQFKTLYIMFLRYMQKKSSNSKHFLSHPNHFQGQTKKCTPRTFFCSAGSQSWVGLRLKDRYWCLFIFTVYLSGHLSAFYVTFLSPHFSIQENYGKKKNSISRLCAPHWSWEMLSILSLFLWPAVAGWDPGVLSQRQGGAGRLQVGHEDWLERHEGACQAQTHPRHPRTGEQSSMYPAAGVDVPRRRHTRFMKDYHVCKCKCKKKRVLGCRDDFFLRN